ncbi:hypothetical protein V8C34DRAFT_191064 [Trichoderma compactum]
MSVSVSVSVFAFVFLVLTKCYKSSFISHRPDRLLYIGRLGVDLVRGRGNTKHRNFIQTKETGKGGGGKSHKHTGQVPTMLQAPVPFSISHTRCLRMPPSLLPSMPGAKGGISQRASPRRGQKQNQCCHGSPSSFMRVRERGNLYTNCRPSGIISPPRRTCGGKRLWVRSKRCRV